MKQAQRVLDILRLLQERGYISSSMLAKEYKVNLRTAQNDIVYIRNFLGDKLIKGENNRYKLQNKTSLNIFF